MTAAHGPAKGQPQAPQQQQVDALKALGVPDAEIQRAGAAAGTLKDALNELIPILAKWLLDRFLSGNLPGMGQQGQPPAAQP